MSFIKDKNGKLLKVDQVCKLHYESPSRCKVPYYVVLQPLDKNYIGCTTGLQTFIPGKHSAALHEYWAHRLEVVGTLQTHGHLLHDQKFE